MRTHAILCLAAFSGSGCGAGGPPLSELPLRDALGAEPEAIAALPPPERRRLAERLEAARGGAAGGPVAPGGVRTLATEVLAVDRARADGGREAMVLA